MEWFQVLPRHSRVAMGMHKLHPRQLPLTGFIHKDRGEADIVMNETTVITQETDGFLEILVVSKACMHIASFSAHDNLMKSPGYGKVGCAITGGNILRQRHSFFSYHIDACWELRQGEMEHTRVLITSWCGNGSIPQFHLGT